jgi:hypothetical protein
MRPTATSAVELSLFEEVADALRALAPAELGELRLRPRRYGIKAWYGPEAPPREHYEAQVIAAEHDADATVLALEVGWHAEHQQVADNEAAISRLVAAERRWRPMIGQEAVAGPFLGRAALWRRVSETWPDPNLDDPHLAVELAMRLTDYVAALEPIRRDGSKQSATRSTRGA